jgi:antibiotic biosynthesis monooxygenase (ABM) superfamily enzyme
VAAGRSDPMATPVKIVLERLVHPGQEAAFRGWTERFTAAAAAAPGHQGASVLSSGTGGAHVILLRFASGAEFERWRESAAYRDALREADASSRASHEPQIRSGLETWFTVPGAPHPVPRWKMALVTWLALMPQVIALSFLLAPLRLPFLAGVALSTAIPVAMLTWVIMPRLTRALDGWLHGR